MTTKFRVQCTQHTYVLLRGSAPHCGERRSRRGVVIPALRNTPLGESTLLLCLRSRVFNTRSLVGNDAPPTYNTSPLHDQYSFQAMSNHSTPFIQSGWRSGNPNAGANRSLSPAMASSSDRSPAMFLYFRRTREKRLCYRVLDHQARDRYAVSTDNHREGFTLIRTISERPRVIATLEWGKPIPFVDLPDVPHSRMPASQWLPIISGTYVSCLSGEPSTHFALYSHRRMTVGNTDYVWYTAPGEKHVVSVPPSP